MKLLKERHESEALQILRYLNTRTTLTDEEKSTFKRIKRGYEGEVKFDALVDDLLKVDCYVIRDLLLEVNHSHFQIDTLIISQSAIHILETKNFQGDWFYESEKFYTVTTRREYNNPVDQLSRCVTLFNQLLQKHNHTFLVDPLVVFIDSEFTLYQAPINLPMLFPSQINRFLKTLDETPSKLGESQKKLAQALLSLHKTKNPFTVLPNYKYDQLKKGIFCKSCYSFSLYKKDYCFICRDCGTREVISESVMRAVNEYTLLFPSEKLTTIGIYDWCKSDLSPKTISRVLKRNFKVCGKTCDTYYE